MHRVYDALMLLMCLVILLLLFRVAMGIHTQACSFTGEVPGDLLPAWALAGGHGAA